MLNKETLLQAYTHTTTTLNSSRVRLTDNGSLLAPAIHALAPCFPRNSNGDIVSRFEYLSEMSDIEKGRDANEMAMEQAGKDLAAQVRPHLNVARNIVKPDVMRFIEAVERANDDANSATPTFYYEIEQVKVPQWLTDPNVGDLLKKTTAMAVGDASSIDFGPRSAAEIRELLLVGMQSIDMSLQDWRESISDSDLSAIWLGVFSNGGNSGRGLNLRALRIISDEVSRLTSAMVVGLIARSLMDNPSAEMKVSLQALRINCEGLISWAVDQVGQAARVIQNDLRNNRVIIRVREGSGSSNSRVMVYDVTYNDFLKQGGCPEMVLGSALRKMSWMFAPDLVKNREVLMKEWERYANTHELAFRENAEQRLRQNVLAAWVSFELCGEGKDASMRMRNTDFQRDHKQALEYITRGKWTQCLCPTEVATYLVAGCAYDFTSAYAILSNMLEIAKHTPDIQPEEVFYLATMYYVSDYFARQFIKA